jgi:hypothetical protein
MIIFSDTGLWVQKNVFILLYCFFPIAEANSQIPIVKGDSIVIIENSLKKLNKNVDFTIVPGPVYGATEKLGFAVLPMIIYNLDKKDKVSPPSSTALLVYFDFHGSWQVAAKQSFYWNENKWRAFSTLGTGVMNRRFYGAKGDTIVINKDPDNYFWIKDRVVIFSMSCYRNVFSGFYGGLEYAFRSHLTGEGNPDENDQMIESGIKPGEFMKESILIPTFVWDNRNNIFWTTKGYFANLSLQFPDKLIVNADNFGSVSGWFNGYHSLLKETADLTLAWSIYFQKGWGNLTYYQLASYGVGDNAMGYRQGKYINQSEVCTQVEVRKDIWKFVSLGGYFGTGKTFESKASFGESVWLHFGGLRTYINILPSRDIRLRLDFALARKDSGFYFGIGQGF